ncbi:helix-turn-helix domain-containing protein [Ligilactobacillus acidipiscis]|uniref:Phage transcriptional regulator, Cro/CI family n=1 Tax=Ligilactobacillus acidipiscis TaxID=89059 RepID=A0A1K1KQ25_9LACO|nr:helix-turn-helix transcriptional regulator [Ligilactobacillus acidipiscis]SFV40993.1 Phage transcriptional regulator, Cro/CI family [Ligilactobacillus acidipiscis]
MSVLDRVKFISKNRGLSLLSLNNKAGLGKNAIYKWEKQKPSAENLEKVAVVLGVSSDYLLGKTDDTSRGKKSADLADDETIFTYEGKPLDDEDKEIIRRLLRGK